MWLSRLRTRYFNESDRAVWIPLHARPLPVFDSNPLLKSFSFQFTFFVKHHCLGQKGIKQFSFVTRIQRNIRGLNYRPWTGFIPARSQRSLRGSFLIADRCLLSEPWSSLSLPVRLGATRSPPFCRFNIMRFVHPPLQKSGWSNQFVAYWFTLRNQNQ